ncbi:protein of unknown function [Methylocaldum szegediense]|uniref:Uncharacterized protein n=1 Tax=Methylocaldum szegediense TaxID=73780 RepID=A0ABM9I959_9GAMM|nr:protein of unknown function [Methylocaldum szegediense]
MQPLKSRASFNPLPVIKPGVTLFRRPGCAHGFVSIHSRLLSRELRTVNRQYDSSFAKFQSTPGY